MPSSVRSSDRRAVSAVPDEDEGKVVHTNQDALRANGERPQPETLTRSLVDIAVEAWRLSRMLDRVLAKLDRLDEAVPASAHLVREEGRRITSRRGPSNRADRRPAVRPRDGRDGPQPCRVRRRREPRRRPDARAHRHGARGNRKDTNRHPQEERRMTTYVGIDLGTARLRRPRRRVRPRPAIRVSSGVHLFLVDTYSLSPTAKPGAAGNPLARAG